MAITIGTINSTSPNLANNKVVYSVGSNKTNEPQFKFVLDINDRNGNLLQRLKQQPNVDYGVGIFNIGQILVNYLGPVDPIWTWSNTTPAYNGVYNSFDNTKAADQFQIRFGEEYASSSTSSAFIYVGGATEQIGTPSISSSHYNYFVDGVLSVNDFDNAPFPNNYNWNSGSKYEEESTDGTTSFTHQFGLTSFNTSSVRLGDYHTISIFNGNLAGVSQSAATIDNTLAQDVYAMVIKEYDATGTILNTDTLYNAGGHGPRSNSTQLWDDVYLDQNWESQLLHWPVGPQNLDDMGKTLDTNTSYYEVSFHNQTLEPGVNDTGIWGKYILNVKDAACDYPGTRFAWKNEYGVWDYFNFELATSATSNIEREMYQQNQIPYGAQIPYNYPGRRGFEQFQNKITKTFTAESNYLKQIDADNLRELFYSTEVYVFNPDYTTATGTTQDAFLPVIIENASVTEKTNPRSQKLFRYTVEWRYANELQPRV